MQRFVRILLIMLVSFTSILLVLTRPTVTTAAVPPGASGFITVNVTFTEPTLENPPEPKSAIHVEVGNNTSIYTLDYSGNEPVYEWYSNGKVGWWDIIKYEPCQGSLTLSPPIEGEYTKTVEGCCVNWVCAGVKNYQQVKSSVCYYRIEFTIKKPFEKIEDFDVPKPWNIYRDGNLTHPSIVSVTKGEGLIKPDDKPPYEDVWVNASYVGPNTKLHVRGQLDPKADLGNATVVIDPEGDTYIYDIEFSAESASAGGACFIATAAYGSPMAKELDTFRAFRDRYLETNPVGSRLVKVYYKYSPPVASFIDDHPALKPVVRAMLTPPLLMAKVALNTTLAQKVAIVCSMTLVGVIVGLWVRRKAGLGKQ